jgi:chemotaxis protein methyltransferase CheR
MIANKVLLKEKEFKLINNLIYKQCGIFIENDKKELLEYKLSKRVEKYNIKSFSIYYEKLLNDKEEFQDMINIVTTNETSFFREMKHFDFLIDTILPEVQYDKFRCWSAAGSNGAEVYSIAMVLNKNMNRWQNIEIVHSDINSKVSKDAKNGIYPIKYTKQIPSEYLKLYCKKGFDENEGLFTINDELKKNIKFLLINLISPLPDDKLGLFDVIFLRNMIIYFDEQHKKLIVENVIRRLKNGGYLFMGHSESLYNITNKVKQIKPSIYQKI